MTTMIADCGKKKRIAVEKHENGCGRSYFLSERLILTSQYTMWMSQSSRTTMPGDGELKIADETGNQL